MGLTISLVFPGTGEVGPDIQYRYWTMGLTISLVFPGTSRDWRSGPSPPIDILDNASYNFPGISWSDILNVVVFRGKNFSFNNFAQEIVLKTPKVHLKRIKNMPTNRKIFSFAVLDVTMSQIFF